MTIEKTESIRCSDFEVTTLEDEIRADNLCADLLKEFCRDLIEAEGMAAQDASDLAYGASYFLREFVIPDRQDNIFKVQADRIRQFAGNWYIIRNLEPNMAELEKMLQGVFAFYRYSLKLQLVSPEQVSAIEAECAKLDYYRSRIESFWDLKDNGYQAWDRECPLTE